MKNMITTKFTKNTKLKSLSCRNHPDLLERRDVETV